MQGADNESAQAPAVHVGFVLPRPGRCPLGLFCRDSRQRPRPRPNSGMCRASFVPAERALAREGSFGQDIGQCLLGLFCQDSRSGPVGFVLPRHRSVPGGFVSPRQRPVPLGSVGPDTGRYPLGSFRRDSGRSCWVRSAKTPRRFPWLRFANYRRKVSFRSWRPALRAQMRGRPGHEVARRIADRARRCPGALFTAQLWRMRLSYQIL